MTSRLGLGVIGAGGFARFVASAAAGVPQVDVVAATDVDVDRAREFAKDFGALAVPDVDQLLHTAGVGAVVIATPPNTHAPLALQAIAAGAHVFCEKPLALSDHDAAEVQAAVEASGLTLLVDHVLRYNPVLAALHRLQRRGLLGEVQRVAFENDAADEDLSPGHWFWDDAISGGILLEHGVHFFDAGATLIGRPAAKVQAIAGSRPNGQLDTVVCTVAHEGGAIATYAHSFSHAHRAERQLMRIDFGLAEARVHGWIPLRADLDLWTDRPEEFERLPGREADLFAVPGMVQSGDEQIAVRVERDAAPERLRARGEVHDAPHRVSVSLQVADPDDKLRVYRSSVGAALHDFAECVHTGAQPRANAAAGRAAVATAAAGTDALHDGNTHRLPLVEAS